MVYLKLFHGRTSPAEQLNDWGTDGPVFGPLSYVHTTYGAHVKLGQAEEPFDNLGDLYVVDGLLFYGGVWYGDWSVCTEDELEPEYLFKHHRDYDEALALEPVTNTRPVYVLEHDKAKQVQEILRRYMSEELRPRLDLAPHGDVDRDVRKDIDYINELARLFD
jgi:hypothetical protein